AKKIKKVPDGQGEIKCLFSSNNTIISITDKNGNVLRTISTGIIGYKNTKKGTPYAAQKLAEYVISLIPKYGIREVVLQTKKIGPGRNITINKIIESANFSIKYLVDKTPIPHGGCRPPNA